MLYIKKIYIFVENYLQIKFKAMRKFLVTLSVITFVLGVSTSCSKKCTCTSKASVDGMVTESTTTYEITKEDRSNGVKKCSDLNGKSTVSAGIEDHSVTAEVTCK